MSPVAISRTSSADYGVYEAAGLYCCAFAMIGSYSSRTPFGIVAGFNPPGPDPKSQPISLHRGLRGCMVISKTVTSFHVQIGRKFSGSGLPDVGGILVINLLDIVDKKPGGAVKKWRARNFPYDVAHPLDEKLNVALRLLCLAKKQCHWICAGWGIKGGRGVECRLLASFAIHSINNWKPKGAAFGGYQDSIRNRPHEVRCAHIGYGKIFFKGALSWRPV